MKIVQEGSFVGVVCETEWAAIKAAKALKVILVRAADQNAGALGRAICLYQKHQEPHDSGHRQQRQSATAHSAQAKKTYEATYRWPFQMHGMMGPSCSVADVGERPSDDLHRERRVLSRPARRSPTCWACRKIMCACSIAKPPAVTAAWAPTMRAEDAALLSRAVGKPVRVQWMRDDEHGWEPKGPAQLDLIRAGIDGEGKIVAWDFADRRTSSHRRFGPRLCACSLRGRSA